MPTKTFKFFFILTLIASCAPKQVQRNLTIQLASKKSIEELWNVSVHQSLKIKLWEEEYIYDSGHFLMVPMHYAFCFGFKSGMKDFREHFIRFLGSYKEDIAVNDKARLHYFYLISQYINLAQGSGQIDDSTLRLAEFIELQLEELWCKKPAWHWIDYKYIGIKERLNWKLNIPVGKDEKKFYRFIFDDEKFLFAIAADLYFFRSQTHTQSNCSIVLKEILQSSYLTFHKKIVYQKDGSWLMQPGALADHPDYAYSGYQKKLKYDIIKPIELQAEDSSHSFRYALWLKSLYRAFLLFDSTKADYFLQLEKSLSNQFVKKIMKKPTASIPYYHLTNYMDGSNGLYCWKNFTDSKSYNGYGPNELSFSLLVGWWSFLQNQSIGVVYKNIDKDWSKAFVSEKNIDSLLVKESLLALIAKLSLELNIQICNH